MEQNNEIIYGKNPVTELLKSKAGVDTVFISESLNPSVQNYYIALAKDCGAVVKKVHPMKLKSLCQSENHQGVAAFASTVEYVTLGQILEVAQRRGESPFVVVCDGIEDPHNLGAIIRTANLAGAHGVIIPKRRAVGLTATVARTSAGALNYTPVAKVTNMANTIEELKEKGVWIFGTAAEGSIPMYKADLTGPTAIVIGSEGDGMSRLVQKNCDVTVHIPMKGRITSLNASAAASILLYEAVRQRLG